MPGLCHLSILSRYRFNCFSNSNSFFRYLKIWVIFLFRVHRRRLNKERASSRILAFRYDLQLELSLSEQFRQADPGSTCSLWMTTTKSTDSEMLRRPPQDTRDTLKSRPVKFEGECLSVQEQVISWFFQRWSESWVLWGWNLALPATENACKVALLLDSCCWKFR